MSDIAWQHGKPLTDDKKKSECKYCLKKIGSGGATRLKIHLAGGDRNVVGCPNVPYEVKVAMANYVRGGQEKRAQKKAKRVDFETACLEEVGEQNVDLNPDDASSSDAEMERVLRMSKESHRVDETRRTQRAMGAGSSRDPNTERASGGNSSMRRSQSVRESVPLPWVPRPRPTATSTASRPVAIDPDVQILRTDPDLFARPQTKQKKLKHMWGNVKEKVGAAFSKWALYHNVPANAAQGPYYKAMVDELSSAGHGVVGPTPYEIYNVYLPRLKEELKTYIDNLKPMWKQYGVTVMCDGWTGPTRQSIINFKLNCDGWTSPTRQSIINFMLNCDGRTVFIRSVNASGVKKDAKYIYGLLKSVVKEVGVEHVVQVVTDNGSNFKKAGMKLMENLTYRLF